MILIGSSEYPSHQSFHSEEAVAAFRASHQGVKQYFTDPNGFGLVSEESLLDLFDTNLYSPEIIERISSWLRVQLAERHDGTSTIDVIVYYIGHGAFRDNSKEYFLAVRRTNDEDPFHSGIDVESLAKSLRRNAGAHRRFLILDACFAGAAVGGFQTPVEQVVRERILSINWDEPGAQAGTALLCSSSKNNPSIWLASGTTFTSALLEVLTPAAVGRNNSLVSLNWLRDQIWRVLRARHGDEAVHPEVHSPDAEQGNIAEINIFPRLYPRRADHSTLSSESRFRGFLNEAYTAAMMTIRRLREYKPEELVLAQKSLIAVIRAIVVSHYDDQKDSLHINANVMIPVSLTGKSEPDFPGLHFLDIKRTLDTYDGVLVIQGWAHDSHCSPPDFALPIDIAEEDVIFGAPKAYVTGQTQVVPDIRNSKQVDRILFGQPGRVIRQVREYLAARTSFRSFVSVLLRDNDEKVGILNIQSTATNISGKNGIVEKRLSYPR